MSPKNSENKAVLTEIFSSIQGEGIYTGTRQIFIRFNRCNLSCTYCDTQVNNNPSFCRYESTPGSKDMQHIENPVPPVKLIDIVKSLSPEIHHSISLTGGEPLLYSDYLKEFLPAACSTRKGFYLETNGTLPGELEDVIDYVDIIAMDIKLPSATGLEPAWKLHKEFLYTAHRKPVFIKAVICEKTYEDEIYEIASIIGDSKVPLVLQPVTIKEQGKTITGISTKRTLELQTFALNYLEDVRIIPQAHKFMNYL